MIRRFILFVVSTLCILPNLPNLSNAQLVPEEVLSVTALSYCPRSAIESSTFSIYDPPSKASTQVVVESDTTEDRILVAFRGTTQSISQWASNLEVKYDKWTEGRVHTGFLKRYIEIRDETIRFIKNSRKQLRDADLIITGHSMGGAVATLFSSMLVSLKEPDLYPHAVYTFGSPRVGDSRFSKFVDRQLGDRLVRITNEFDMVPDLPPKLMGYRHTGLLVICRTSTSKCTKHGRMAENPGGVLKVLQRATKTADNVRKCHLTYMDHGMGTGLSTCAS